MARPSFPVVQAAASRVSAGVRPIKFSTDEMIDLVRDYTRYRGAITEDSTLQHDLGVFGDDMSGLLDAYAERFGVNMSKYLWYFHTGEEGLGIGALFFKPPNHRVDEIPITVRMLHDFANRGEWAVTYPEHTLPTTRIDVLINQVFIVSFVVLAIVVAAFKLWR